MYKIRNLTFNTFIKVYTKKKLFSYTQFKNVALEKALNINKKNKNRA